MNVLIVGNGPGSWTMRGKQLGAAIGARVMSTPDERDWRWADRVVLVKRAGVEWAKTAHQFGVPIVWDALDFWRQSAENGLTEMDASALLASQIKQIQPILTIGATQAMADACDGMYVPHHSWRGLEPMRIRQKVEIVGYQGNPAYLGKWGPAIERACRARGWKFAFDDTAELWHSDILVAFRDGPWDGWMCRNWKSGVKLVNAIAAGRPIVTQQSAAVAEIQPFAGLLNDPKDLDDALDAVTDVSVRQQALEFCRVAAPRYRLPSVAALYASILSCVEAPCTTT